MPRAGAGDDCGEVLAKQRLDILLTERGLFPSRTRAAASVMAGEVLVGSGRRRASKPSELIDVVESVSVEAGPAYVSRGGSKLENALTEMGLSVAGRMALDVGASTGGFTDCLLGWGSERVVAVDVGYGELHWRLRNDDRVTVLERTNARSLGPEDLPYRPDLAVIDVSFISLEKVLPAVLSCMTAAYDVLALVKPQFEVGKGLVGKGGVVRDGEQRRGALIAVGEAARGLGAAVLGYSYSGLPGPKGNRESFIWLAEAGREGGAGGAEDVAAMARRVEPGEGEGAA